MIGERAGTRTQDHLIKSQVLYHLSYALAERSPVLWGAPLGDLGAHSKPENRGQYHALVGIPAAFGPERTVDLVRSHSFASSILAGMNGFGRRLKALREH